MCYLPEWLVSLMVEDVIMNYNINIQRKRAEVLYHTAKPAYFMTEATTSSSNVIDNKLRYVRVCLISAQQVTMFDGSHCVLALQ